MSLLIATLLIIAQDAAELRERLVRYNLCSERKALRLCRRRDSQVTEYWLVCNVISVQDEMNIVRAERDFKY